MKKCIIEALEMYQKELAETGYGPDVARFIQFDNLSEGNGLSPEIHFKIKDPNEGAESEGLELVNILGYLKCLAYCTVQCNEDMGTYYHLYEAENQQRMKDLMKKTISPGHEIPNN